MDAAGLIARCRWARDHNDGHPNGAWSTGEQLAVALVLRNRAYLDAAGWTPTEVAQRLVGEGLASPEGFPAWLDAIRTQV
jgi:hypothetical protein